MRDTHPKTFNPHWPARDPQSTRLVLGAELGGEDGVFNAEGQPASRVTICVGGSCAAVATVIEIISTSSTSFDDAVTQGIAKASETISGIAGAWVQDQSVEIANGKVTAYKVTLKLTFVLKES